MEQIIAEYTKKYKKEKLPEIRPGDTVRVYEKWFDGKKERIQMFEGIVIARKHGEEIGATITVRRVIDGVGVEKTFPLHSPNIEKIEIVKRAKVRRAKLYYLRRIIGKIRLKRKELKVAVREEEKDEELKTKEDTETLPEKEKEADLKQEEVTKEETQSNTEKEQIEKNLEESKETDNEKSQEDK